ncbi:MAG: helix-hairpin-helix domain-containing protein [Longimicrobiaceae bacterium]
MQNLRPDGPPAAAPAEAPATESRGAPAPADPPAVKAASLSPRARKAAATVKAAPRKPAKRWVQDEKGGFAYKRVGPDLREDLRAFVTARPGGWGHEDWLAFLDHLRERGHDTSDPEALGRALERERLAAILERVQGMGPKRVSSVVDRYETVWSCARADVDEIATLPGMNRALAEKVRQALNG